MIKFISNEMIIIQERINFEQWKNQGLAGRVKVAYQASHKSHSYLCSTKDKTTPAFHTVNLFYILLGKRVSNYDDKVAELNHIYLFIEISCQTPSPGTSKKGIKT